VIRRFHGHDGAQSLVEFALVLPVILLIITGLFDVARAVWQENTLAYAAREGSRYAIVHGSASTDPVWPGSPNNNAALRTVVKAAAVGVPNITTVVAWPSGGCYDRSCPVSVEVSAPFVPIPSQYLLGSTFQITLRGGSTFVIQR